MEVFLKALFALLALKGCHSQVHHRSLDCKFGSSTQECQDAIPGRLGGLLGYAPQLLSQRPPTHGPASHAHWVSNAKLGGFEGLQVRHMTFDAVMCPVCVPSHSCASHDTATDCCDSHHADSMVIEDQGCL